jgi:CelD/BcsL family acetyltransferase involved in cellulose biosynthesis
MYAQGLLDLTFLTVNNSQRAAAMWNFAYKGRMMLYNSGLNPVDYPSLSPGIVLLTYNIEHTIASGYSVYDFLQGDEEYKFRMGATPIQVKNLQITR